MLQGLSSKEAELLKDGISAEKNSNNSNKSPGPTEFVKNVGPSAAETDTLGSAYAPSPCDLESQPKTEIDAQPSTSGTSKSHIFKVGAS